MAKTKGPLLSLDAHGSLNKILTYSNRKSGQQVRKYNKPLAAPSAKQRGQRRLTEFLVAQWQSMSSGQRATWEANAKASSKNLPGYQYFLREAHRDLYTHHGLCLYVPLNEYVGGKVKDLSGNGLDGTPGPSYPSNAPTLVNSRTSKFGHAISCDGVDEYITFGNPAILNFGLGDFTIIWWFYLDGDQDSKSPLSKWFYISDAQGYYFFVNSGPVIQFRIGDGSVGRGTTFHSIPLNTWICVVGRRFDNSIDLHINNVFKNLQAATALNVDSSEPFTLGVGINLTYDTKCRIDEVCIYNRKIEAAELTTRYKFALREAG